MAEPQRFIRQEAEDFINDIAGRSPTLIDQSTLEVLHDAIFDRDAAVRMAIAEALGKLRRPESVNVLKRLLTTETESQWV
ncbi:MAG: HEAT repeat domain-containing protein, partial [Acidobacteria bacterium]|nr:HEAT repeat domain-containing protein [Acidobacteriota bacterium]